MSRNAFIFVVLLVPAVARAQDPGSCQPGGSPVGDLIQVLEDALAGLGLGEPKLPSTGEIQWELDRLFEEALRLDEPAPQSEEAPLHPGNRALYDGMLRVIDGVEGVEPVDGVYQDMTVPRWEFEMSLDQLEQAVASLAVMGGELGADYGLESYFNARSDDTWLIGEGQIANIGTVEQGGSVVNVDGEGNPTNVLWRMGIWADGVEIDPEALLTEDGQLDRTLFDQDPVFRVHIYGEEVRDSAGKWVSGGERQNDGPRPGMDKPVGEPFVWDPDSDWFE